MIKQQNSPKVQHLVSYAGVKMITKLKKRVTTMVTIFSSSCLKIDESLIQVAVALDYKLLVLTRNQFPDFSSFKIQGECYPVSRVAAVYNFCKMIVMPTFPVTISKK